MAYIFRYLLVLWSLFITFFICLANDSTRSTVVTLDQGALKGFKEKSTKGKEIFSFLGIPYAQPPIGELRFQDPLEHKGWNGVRDATQKSPVCSQIARHLYLNTKSLKFLGNSDCLFINVHTTMLDSTSLSVMVYFHGGAFSAGTANEFQPEELLNEDIVLVTVNYRLGLQGFLSTGDDVIKGNFGLKDQVLALRWVNRNIHKFGGDSKKTTIFGHSAGAASVHFHILSEESRDLFSRAILQAGSLLCPWAMTNDVRKTAFRIGGHFNCFEGKEKLEGKTKSLKLRDCLKNIDDATLTKTLPLLFEWAMLPVLTAPHVDGSFLQHPETLMHNSSGKKLDVMYGFSRDEGAWVSNCLVGNAERKKAMVDNFSSVGPLSLGLTEENGLEISRDAYQKFVDGVNNEKEEDLEKLTKMFGDRHFKMCTDWVAFFQAKTNDGSNKKSFFYEFHHRGQRSMSDTYNLTYGKHWVLHGDELFYLFPMKEFGIVERTEEEAILRDIMVKLWTNFAKIGNPTPDGSLGFIWEEFSPISRKHLNIQPTPYMEGDTNIEAREFWASVPTTQNRLLFGEDKEFKIFDHKEL